MGKEKVYIIGHKNPDTDSICSAIAYAELKNQTEERTFIPKRAGRVNEETEFVLRYFGVPTPGIMRDAGTEVGEIEIHKIRPVKNGLSVRNAWNIMREEGVVTLPIIYDDGTLEGLITVSDIAKSYMDIHDNDILAQARTSIGSIAATLDGRILVGDPERVFESGKVIVGAFRPEMMESCINAGDFVIMGNRAEDLLCALELKVAGIVVGLDAEISELILHLADEQNCTIISSPHDTYTIARMINQALPVRYLMRKDNLVKFHLHDKITEIRETMKNLRHRDFPVLDRDEKYVGTISRRNLIGSRGKKMILVDHNEKSQAVDHIEETEILEMIDHHRVGSIETINPILFRNEPVGCTATIIYTMYQERGVEIPRAIAGLLLSAILSDTLMFNSPTCTARDRAAAEALAETAGISDIEAYAKQMFRAGSDLSGKEPEEILCQDFKRFNVEDITFGVGQISSLDQDELSQISSRLNGYIGEVFDKMELDMVFFMLTNILTQKTELLIFGEGAKELIERLSGQEIRGNTIVLRNLVSRKKQLIPGIVTALQNQ